MRGLSDGDGSIVFATAHGSGAHPDWYHNLVANPAIVIERGAETVPVRAVVLTGPARDAALARWLERVPLVAGVLARVSETGRAVPVIRLEPRLEEIV